MAQRAALDAVNLAALVAGPKKDLATRERTRGTRSTPTRPVLVRARAIRLGWDCCQHQRILTFLVARWGSGLPQSSQNSVAAPTPKAVLLTCQRLATGAVPREADNFQNARFEALARCGNAACDALARVPTRPLPRTAARPHAALCTQEPH